MKQNELIANAVCAIWDAYMFSSQLQQEAQLQEAQNLLYRFSTPELTKETLTIVGSEFSLISSIVNQSPLGTIASVMLLIASLIDADS